MKFNALTAEIFGAEDDLGVERAAQPTVREITFPEGPAASSDTSLADAEFSKVISGEDDLTDDFGLPLVKTLTPKSSVNELLAKTAQLAAKHFGSALQRIQRIPEIRKEAPSRSAAIKTRIMEPFRQATLKLFKLNRLEGAESWAVKDELDERFWAIQRSMEEYVTNALLEA